MSLVPVSTRRCALALSALMFATGCGSSVDPLGPAVDMSLMIMTPAAASATLHGGRLAVRLRQRDSGRSGVLSGFR